MAAQSPGTQVTHPPTPPRLPRDSSSSITCGCSSGIPTSVLGVPHVPHLLAPGPGHPRMLVTWTLLAGLRLGAELETRRGGPLLRRRCPLRGCVVPALGGRGSSGGLGRAERRGEGGERSGRLGGEERGGSPGLSALEVTQLEPRLLLHASIHLHSRVHWLIHILSPSFPHLRSRHPAFSAHQGGGGVRGPQSRGGPRLYLLPHLTD